MTIFRGPTCPVGDFPTILQRVNLSTRPSRKPTTPQTSTNTYAGLTYDWDNDQTDDIFIVNYNQPNQLFMGVRNQGIVIPGAFTEVTTDPITLDSKPSIGATTFARLFPAVFRLSPA